MPSPEAGHSLQDRDVGGPSRKRGSRGTFPSQGPPQCCLPMARGPTGSGGTQTLPLLGPAPRGARRREHWKSGGALGLPAPLAKHSHTLKHFTCSIRGVVFPSMTNSDSRPGTRIPEGALLL